MIANFALMGSLYQHNSFDHITTGWNEYPWQIGFDNGVEISTAEISRSSMAQSIWELGTSNDQLLDSNLAVSAFSALMFASLINIDMWGNIGSDVGNDPEAIPSEEITPAVVNASIISITSIAALIIADSNSELSNQDDFVGIVAASVTSVSSLLTLIIADSNSELSNQDDFVGITSASILSVSSVSV